MQKVEKRIDHAITPSRRLSRHFPSNRQWDLRFRGKKLPRPERRYTTGNVRGLRHAGMTRRTADVTLSLMSVSSLGHPLDWSSFPPESPTGCAFDALIASAAPHASSIWWRSGIELVDGYRRPPRILILRFKCHAGRPVRLHFENRIHNCGHSLRSQQDTTNC